MAMLTTLPKQPFLHKIKPLTPIKPTPTHCTLPSHKTHFPIIFNIKNAKAAALIGTGLAITALVSPATAVELTLTEPTNALSLPTWAIHVSSVAEWVIAMALVWQYGEESGYESWKGLSWGMVPLLGGAFCACTWHFFYNSESLEVLVALQAALTVIGNGTMCVAAYRIFKSTKGGQEKINELPDLRNEALRYFFDDVGNLVWSLDYVVDEAFRRCCLQKPVLDELYTVLQAL
ncbi:hypothetical protein POM88_022612 [Heracleum sosnowskyi]|uniref:Ycf49-like protein n=1 Tax=Heracleum sosnowskyi TaxID=360622 RepID=A0AAD8IFB5_9APIA|nr:hypothetical protein POM88_022612 [Heracleum sosnowskyi]